MMMHSWEAPPLVGGACDLGTGGPEPGQALLSAGPWFTCWVVVKMNAEGTARMGAVLTIATT
jgi:hypothetical protein